MDNTPAEKVYVAVGNDLQDGFKTLEWTLRKWGSHPISIVVLHVIHNISKEYVYTPCKLFNLTFKFCFAFSIGFQLGFTSFMFMFQLASFLLVL